MKRRSLFAVLLAGALAAAAAAFWIASPGLLEPTLGIEPATLDFGSLAVGADAQQLVVATNHGSKPVEIDAIAVDAPFKTSRRSLTLEPGGTGEIVVHFAPQASGAVSAALRFESRALRGGSLSLPLAGEAHLPAHAEIDPLFVSFGDVGVDGAAKALLTIRNHGEETLSIDAVAAGRPFAAQLASLSVAPGATETVELRFEPKALGFFQDNVQIRTNDPERETIVVGVEGSAVAAQPKPLVKVTPPRLDFGSVPVGASGEQWVSIRNDGSDPLHLTSLGFAGPFSGPTRSRRIEAGDEIKLPVHFAPAAEGSQSAPLKIYTNDPQAGVITVALLGEGVRTAGAPASPEGGTELAAQGAALGGTGSVGSAAAGEGTGDDSGSTPPDPVDGEDTGTAVQPDVLDGSKVRLGSYGAEFGEGSAEGISYNPSSGLLQIDGLQLPDIGASLGEYFRFSPTSGAGIVDQLGEATITLPIEMLDAWGNPTHMVMELTTSVSSAVYDRTVVSISGSPCSSSGRCTFVGQIRQPTGSPFGGEPMKVTLNVQIPKKSR